MSLQRSNVQIYLDDIRLAHDCLTILLGFAIMQGLF